MTPQIIIPANQICKAGDMLKIIINATSASGLELYIKCSKLTTIGKTPIKFAANRFTPWNRRHNILPDEIAALSQSLT